MTTYFHGWRRKLGVVTLVMACVFVVGWVRSETIGDFIQFDHRKNDDNWDWIYSSRQRLFWQRTYNDPDYARKMPRFKMGSYKIRIRANDVNQQNSTQYIYRKRALGFELAWFSPYGGIAPPYSQTIAVPYWSIAIPLTLLSAYLLLVKLRPKKTQIQPDNI